MTHCPWQGRYPNVVLVAVSDSFSLRPSLPIYPPPPPPLLSSSTKTHLNTPSERCNTMMTKLLTHCRQSGQDTRLSWISSWHDGQVAKVSVLCARDWGSSQGKAIPLPYKLEHYWLSCPTPGIPSIVLIAVNQTPFYSHWVRQQV